MAAAILILWMGEARMFIGVSSEGLVLGMVKTMARGKQRRRAQQRDSGVGDSMVVSSVYFYREKVF